MTAIDSRATITCNLGEVISGGVSDSYLQNSGLVFTRGQLTLVGVSTPQIGTKVTISYTMASGASGGIPRDLVVLSAFADPFRETTEVSLGCTLTYLDGVMPVPSLEDGDASYIGPRRLECLNGLAKSAFVPPIFADELFSYCVSKLGLSSAGVNLEGTYVMDKYDLSGGYVGAIGNLLLSEGKVGYMSGASRLEVVSLSKGAFGGASLGVNDIIDVSGVNSGEQPANIVIVPYIDKRLKRYNPDEARWEEVESVGNPESVTIAYDGGTVTVTHTPVTKTITEYGPPNNLTDQCALKDGGFGDLSDTVVKTTTTRSTCLGHAAGGYVTALKNSGKPANETLDGEVKEITEYEFDDKDRPKRTVKRIYEPFFVYAGRMSLQWVFNDNYVDLGNEELLVEEQIEEYDYAGEANIPEGLRPGVDVNEPVVYQRVSRATYQAWGKTQGGSQGPAESTSLEVFQNASEVLNYVFGSLGLVLTDSEVTANKAFNPKGQRRPGEADRAVQQGTLDEQGRKTKYVELQFADNGDGTRVVQYSPPHLTESYFTPEGLPVNVDSYAASANFGRVQHRLAVGNRLGMNITSTPDKLDLEPYGGLSVSAAGYSATYGCNGLNYSFGRDGIVASVDALYLGGNGVGGAGRKLTKKQRDALGPCWFYLPDGYDPNSLPPASDDQLIPPFNERVNVVAGVAIGPRVQGQLTVSLVDKTVEIGIALGVDGTNGNYKQVAEVGVAAGVEATSALATLATVELGVALGTNTIVKFDGVRTVELGVAVGVNIGPAPIVPALLMHFDDAADLSETTWTDSSPNNLTITNTAAGEGTTFVFLSNPDFDLYSRFGAGFAFFLSGAPFVDTIEARGGLLSERVTALNMGDEWTIEFWLKLNTADMPEAGQPQGPWTVLCMDHENYRIPIEIEVVFETATGTPSLKANIYRAEGFLEQIDGAAVVVDSWLHVALVKTLEGVYLFQGGQRQGGFGGTNVQLQPVNRVAVGGWLREDDTTIPFDHGVFDMDELRIVNNRAVYDINNTTLDIPTGPFSS